MNDIGQEFRARINIAKEKLTRIYIHEDGFEEFYRLPENGLKQCKYFLSELERQCRDTEKVMANLGILYIDEQKREVLEFFSLGKVKEWPGNAEIYSLILKNGIYQPEERNISCDKGFLLAYEDIKYRLRTKSFEEFSKKPPTIAGFSPVYDINDFDF